VLEVQGLDLLLGASTVEAFLCPELALLRKDPNLLSIPCIAVLPDVGPCVDRLACLRIMRDAAVPGYDAFLAAQLLDSVRHSDEALFHVPIAECRFDSVCNELTLATNPLHIHALDLSFFNSLSAVDVPLHYLLSKVINQRCQGRKFSVVAIRGITENNKIAKQLQELVLCSLLGNYCLSDPASRPGPVVRDLLFRLLRSSVAGQPSEWLTMLLQHCRSIVMYCLREQVVFAVEEQPALKAQIESLVQFEQFKAIACQCMSVLRDYVGRMLCTPSSSLYGATFNSDAVSADSRWVQEIAFLVQPFDSAMLKISYRRPKQSFRQFLLSVGNKYENDSEELPRLVSTDEIDALRALAERLSHCRFGILNEIVRWLPHFRVSKEIAALMSRLMQSHHSGSCSLDRLRHYLLELQKLNPRAFQLLHIAAELIQDTQKVKLLARLPAHYIRAQIDACQGRFGMKSKNPRDRAGAVLDHLFYFVYCDVCFTVYSLLADSNSVYKQDYSFGTRDAVIDYQTRELYCQRNRHTHRGACHKQPLTKVFLLGNVLQVNGAMVMLCPQVKCGRPMVINKDCVTTPRGRACCYCTQKLQPSRVNFQGLLDYYTKNPTPRRCAVCAEVLNKTAEIYVYGGPLRIYVCRRHNSTTLVSHVKELVKAQSEDSTSTDAQKREEMESLIVHVAVDREREMRTNKVKAESGKRKLQSMIAASNKRDRKK